MQGPEEQPPLPHAAGPVSGAEAPVPLAAPADASQDSPARRIRPASPPPLNQTPEPQPLYIIDDPSEAVESEALSDLAELSRQATGSGVAPVRTAPKIATNLRQSIALRRTFVPILLTMGVMLPTLGGLWFATEENSPFRAVGKVIPLLLIVVGMLLLAVGLLNALYLRHQLRSLTTHRGSSR